MSLPTDLLPDVLSYLSGAETARCERVCKEWRSVAQGNGVWQGLLERDFPWWESDGSECPRASYRRAHAKANRAMLSLMRHLRCLPCFGEAWEGMPRRYCYVADGQKKRIAAVFV